MMKLPTIRPTIDNQTYNQSYTLGYRIGYRLAQANKFDLMEALDSEKGNTLEAYRKGFLAGQTAYSETYWGAF